jgi:transposase
MQESFNRMLVQYEFLSAQIDKQTRLLRELSETAIYRDRVEIVQNIPGIGMISAMELLLELQDVSRFRAGRTTGGVRGFNPVSILQCG